MISRSRCSRLRRLRPRACLSIESSRSTRWHAQIVTARGETLPYDLISLAAGSEIPTTIEGADRWAVPVRPLEPFVTTWSLLGPRLAEADRPRITVVGAGAGGVEIALAIAYAMRAAGNGSQVQLISGGALLPGHGERARELVRASLVQAQVRLLDSSRRAHRQRSRRSERRRLTGERLDRAGLWCGACALGWHIRTAVGRRRIHRGRPRLRSVSHSSVFAAGDLASVVGSPQPRSGVYAVRAGPLLADNLIRQLQGAPLRSARARRSRALPARDRTAARDRFLVHAGVVGAMGLALEGPHRPPLHRPVQKRGVTGSETQRSRSSADSRDTRLPRRHRSIADPRRRPVRLSRGSPTAARRQQRPAAAAFAHTE